MKKFIAILFSILLCALISMSAISPAQADIEKFTWLPPYIERDDDNGVVIYRHGSTVKLAVPVKNDVYDGGLNVSKVIISFDWGQNKTLDLSADPTQIGKGNKEIFTVSFTADATEAVSSDLAHTYTIYVEHVNATTGPKKIVKPTWEVEWDDFPDPDYKFVVFSTDQADALDLKKEYESYPTYSFSSTNASQLAGQAYMEKSLGDEYYNKRRDYASAKTHYQTALNLYGQALATEKEWMTKWEEARLNAILTTTTANMTMANARLREADAVLNQSYAWILFGLGFTFMGIATIIYASKKPKAA